MVSEAEPSFFVRLWLCWVCFFRVLFDAKFAAHVQQLPAEPPALPPAPKAPEPASAARPAPAFVAPERAALQLLSLLQREGRFVDFIQQDIGSYADGEVGAAARVVHQGCRKALASLATVTAIRSEAEGSRVELEAGFDAKTVKLVGDVQGSGPYRGVLRHKGWRAASLALPELVGDHDPHVLAPAEVEL
ncbi:MAG TPA: DUF2760 domain-containing protein [Polyangiaceae bacterium]|nr:DUF2760 domain-containing protein [Polyangiaceae bacterium]